MSVSFSGAAIVVGSRVNITCAFTTYGSVTYSFIKDGVVLLSNSSSNTLADDMTVQGSVAYQCTAEGSQGNGRKTSYTYQVSVSVKGGLARVHSMVTFQ